MRLVYSIAALLLILNGAARAEPPAGAAQPEAPPPAGNGPTPGPVGQTPTEVVKPEIKALGGDKYQVGSILVDKAKKQFSVAGKVLRLEPPIEFLAVTKGGYKAYESYLELETNAYEFNLACILIGLEEHKAAPPKFHFDPAPLKGSSAEIKLAWEADGDSKEVDMAKIFKSSKEEEGNWVYTGSRFIPDGGYAAALAGTLIGLIHDPDSIIEHGVGFGQASYGNLKPDAKLSPPVNAQIRLTVKFKK